MGLVILGALVLYALISIVVVLLAIRHAKKNGKSATRWGWGAALVMYLIPFWDWLPTVAMHQYYCATEAGFWVQKSIDQWKAENPGVIDTLSNQRKTGSRIYEKRYHEGRVRETTYHLNERFSWIIKHEDQPWVLPIIRIEEIVMDVRGNEVVARYIDFATGNSVKNTIGPPGPVRFWLVSRHCSGGAENQGALRAVRNESYGGGK